MLSSTNHFVNLIILLIFDSIYCQTTRPGAQSSSISINFCGSVCYNKFDTSGPEESRRCFCNCLRKKSFNVNNLFFKFICFGKGGVGMNVRNSKESTANDSVSGINDIIDFVDFNYPDYYDMYSEELAKIEKFFKNNGDDLGKYFISRN